jgi:hypothetical protein
MSAIFCGRSRTNRCPALENLQPFIEIYKRIYAREVDRNGSASFPPRRAFKILV